MKVSRRVWNYCESVAFAESESFAGFFEGFVIFLEKGKQKRFFVELKRVSVYEYIEVLESGMELIFWY